jgi:hypothetical protein
MEKQQISQFTEEESTGVQGARDAEGEHATGQREVATREGSAAKPKLREFACRCLGRETTSQT